MAIPLPRLDDRSFDQLVRQALDRAKATCPEWTDFSPGDPGVTLVELFAFLTEAMLYRLNRVPPKLRLALLNLAGVAMQPSAAAVVDLTFTRRDGTAKDQPLAIPAGTAVSSADGSVQFLLAAAASIAAGKNSTSARALHCEQIDAEMLGITSGIAGQAFRVARAPIIVPTADGLDCLVGVEVAEGVATAGLPLRRIGGKSFEIWNEVALFAESSADDPVYMLDRASGTVQFGPPRDAGAGAGRVPAAGLAVRAWYRRGGGRTGNVAPGTLTALRSGPEGLEVSNPARAVGGADAETIAQLERRAPNAISSLRVAVTARDYEQVVLDTRGFARAHAYAQAQVWRHADPGLVEVSVMPQIDAAALVDGAITADVVLAHRTDALRDRAIDAVDKRRPLGIRAQVSWARVRPVSVNLRVVIGSEADAATVAHGVRQRINTLFSPMRDLPFGQQLRASEVYERVLNEPGVRYADQLAFTIGETPSHDVINLISDPAQANSWFAVTKTEVNRTLDDGESWCTVYRPQQGEPRFIRRHPTRPGLAVLGVVKGNGSTVLLTEDLGESWSEPLVSFTCEVHDAAWVERDGKPMLLLATAEGLRQFIPGSGSGPAPVIVDKTVDTGGFYAVVASISPAGVISVAVAAKAAKGVFLSSAGGVSGTFKKIGLDNKDVKRLAVQSTAARTFLWATIGAEAGEQGEGASRLELRADGAQDPDGFKPFNIGWQGGSCEGIAFADGLVVAGSNRAGLLQLDASAAKPAWLAVKPDGGLPIRDTERFFEVVAAVAAVVKAGGSPMIFSGGARGVHRSIDGGRSFAPVSSCVFADHVPLPARWLYCVGEHHIDIVQDQDGRS